MFRITLIGPQDVLGVYGTWLFDRHEYHQAATGACIMAMIDFVTNANDSFCGSIRCTPRYGILREGIGVARAL